MTFDHLFNQIRVLRQRPELTDEELLVYTNTLHYVLDNYDLPSQDVVERFEAVRQRDLDPALNFDGIPDDDEVFIYRIENFVGGTRRWDRIERISTAAGRLVPRAESRANKVRDIFYTIIRNNLTVYGVEGGIIEAKQKLAQVDANTLGAGNALLDRDPNVYLQGIQVNLLIAEEGADSPEYQRVEALFQNSLEALTASNDDRNLYRFT